MLLADAALPSISDTIGINESLSTRLACLATPPSPTLAMPFCALQTNKSMASVPIILGAAVQARAFAHTSRMPRWFSPWNLMLRSMYSSYSLPNNSRWLLCICLSSFAPIVPRPAAPTQKKEWRAFRICLRRGTAKRPNQNNKMKVRHVIASRDATFVFALILKIGRFLLKPNTRLRTLPRFNRGSYRDRSGIP